MLKIHETTSAREILRVKNFAGIQQADFELSRMNVFIGPQASGKSVCAKLLFYFKEIIRRIAVDVQIGDTKPQIRTKHKDLFLNYFPPSCWGKGMFEIQYSFGELWVKIDRAGSESSTVKVSYSDYYDSLLFAGRKALKKAQNEEDAGSLESTTLEETKKSITEKVSQDIGRPLGNQNYFIPAGRSFFSTLRGTVFTFIAGNVGIDPFLAEFGRLYENIRRVYNSPPSPRSVRNKQISEHISKLICGTYKRVAGSDYIQADDGRQVAVENSSSGQQEALPFALLLARFARTAGGVARSTFFVEEPEAHLYPSAQREIVHLLSAVVDLSSDISSSQYVITTHSPYILSALNNLMYGEQIARHKPEKRDQVKTVLGGAALIAPANVRAYSFINGRVQSIIDGETKLVEAAVLDEVSNELASEFEALVDISYEEQAA